MSLSFHDRAVAIVRLWRQFIPLSMSDVTMACGDPLVNGSVAHLPHATSNLAALGTAKAIAVLFESPVIMLLHAANVMAPSYLARRALKRLMLIISLCLTVILVIASLPSVFAVVAHYGFNLSVELTAQTREALLFFAFWPAFIAWRRYYQGLLVRGGHANHIAIAGMLRLGVVGAILAVGAYQNGGGIRLAGLALITGVFSEAVAVTLFAKLHGVELGRAEQASVAVPTNVSGVWRFYWPLAASMVLVWTSRALLVAVIARSIDAPIALAAWPAAWGLVLVIANATRMVQQIIIRNRPALDGLTLMFFALSIGMCCTLVLLAFATTNSGLAMVSAFFGANPEIIRAAAPVLQSCIAVPLLVALQNAIQGFLIFEGRTKDVNLATIVGTITLLLSACSLVYFSVNGATAAALAMTIAISTELSVLAWKVAALRDFCIVFAKSPVRLLLRISRVSSW